MLARISHPARREHRQEARPRSRRTSFVHGDGTRLEPKLEPGVTEPAAEIEVFAVEEEAFVETAQIFKSRAPDQQARSRSPLGPAGALVGFRVAHELVGPLRVGEEPVEEERLSIRRAKTRKPTLRKIQRPVFGHDPRRYRADPGSVLCDADQAPDRSAVDRGVGVKEECEGRVSPTPADVARVCEAAVLGKLDDRDREVGDALDRPVARGAIDDDNAQPGSTRKGLDASPKVVLAVVGDDDDVHLGHEPTVPARWMVLPLGTALSTAGTSAERGVLLRWERVNAS
jgi:hypothetical protein